MSTDQIDGILELATALVPIAVIVFVGSVVGLLGLLVRKALRAAEPGAPARLATPHPFPAFRRHRRPF